MCLLNHFTCSCTSDITESLIRRSFPSPPLEDSVRRLCHMAEPLHRPRRGAPLPLAAVDPNSNADAPAAGLGPNKPPAASPSPGTTTFRLVYRRVWEVGVPPAQSKLYEVRVEPSF